MYKKSDLLLTVLHVPMDVLAIVAAFIISYWLRGAGSEIYKLPFDEYLAMVYQSVPIWVAIFVLQGLYTRRYQFGTLRNISRLAITVLAAWASFMVFLVFTKSEQTLVFPRLMLIYILILGFLFVFAGRVILRLGQYVARTLGVGRRRMVVMGKSKSAKSLELALQNTRDPGIQFIKRLNLLAPKELLRQIKRHQVDELIIADTTISENQTLEYIISVQNVGVVCHLAPNMFEVQASNVLFDTIAGTPLVTFRQTPLDGWGRIVKRLLDIGLSFFVLIVLSPVLLIVAAAIKLTDPGPVFYRHSRISRGGKKFQVYKFRTMLARYCAGPGFSGQSELEIYRDLGRQDLVAEFLRDHKVKDDPRVSSIGKFLRKTSLDELPQLVNVLGGELSLVGPRPIVEAELARYGRWASYLLSIKPGLTGLWQISGRNDISYDERVRLDSHYVQNWSLGQDFIIMIKTAWGLFGGRGHGY